MRIFAIGDLHLSTAKPKEMDIFGPQWVNHWERIQEDWTARVADSDVVLVPGDISWALRLGEAKSDLEAIGRLPGQKILIRGNHDYWWSSPAKVRSVLPDGMHIIQNDALKIEDTVFCGTRGWMFPAGGELSAEDQKIFEREKIRLDLSLSTAERLGGEKLVVLLHYPPLYENMAQTDFTTMLEEHHPRHVVFGHLHGEILSQIHMRDLVKENIHYHLVSADYLDFRLFELL